MATLVGQLTEFHAGPTLAPTVRGDIGIEFIEDVLPVTMGLAGFLSCKAIAAKYINLACNWLKVFWINTGSYSTEVVYRVVLWDRAICYLISKSVSEYSMAINLKPSVAIRISKCHPKPAWASLVHFRPESGFCWNYFSWVYSFRHIGSIA